MTRLITMISILMMINACAYKPVIDTAGRSDSHVTSSAADITNDLQHCEQLADENSSLLLDSVPKGVWNYYIRAYTLYILPERETDYKSVYKACMTQRGHAVIK